MTYKRLRAKFGVFNFAIPSLKIGTSSCISVSRARESRAEGSGWSDDTKRNFTRVPLLGASLNFFLY